MKIENYYAATLEISTLSLYINQVSFFLPTYVMCDTFNFQSVNFFCHMPHQMRVLLLLLVASFGFVPQVHGESTPEVAVEDQTDAGEEQDAFEGVPEDQEVDMESLFTALFEGKKRKNETFC